MRVPHVVGNFSRPADNTAYASGDAIANSGTAGLVVPITFNFGPPLGPLGAVPRSGYITGCSSIVTPASGSLVITALDFDLLLFRPEVDIPFAAGGYAADNAALAISAAAFRELVGVFSFANGAWRNPAGALTAGITGFQAVASAARVQYPFNLGGMTTVVLLGLVQAKAAWTPTGVVNRFDFKLDIEMDE